jgi:D-ribulokinase
LPPRLSPIPPARSVYFQGVLEGIADIEALGYHRLAELGATPLNSLRSVGGGAGNQPWSEIRLKKLGVASHSPDSEHAAMGVARLAWWGIGHNDA